MKIKVNKYNAPQIMKMIRENLGMTQVEFAKSINMSLGSVQKYENGQRRYSLELLIFICNKFDIELIMNTRHNK